MAITVSKTADPKAAQAFTKIIQKARGVVIPPEEKAARMAALKAKLKRYLDDNPKGQKAKQYRETLADLDKGIWRTDPSLKPGAGQTVPADAQLETKLRRYLQKTPKGPKAEAYKAQLKELRNGE